MSTGALTMMLVTEITITLVTGFFFYKVLTMKKNEEEDSYSENNDEK